MVSCFSHDIHLVNFCIVVNDVVLLCCSLCKISDHGLCSPDRSEGRNPCFDCKPRWVDILFTMIYWQGEMGRACSTNGGEEECIWDVGGNAGRKETTRKTKM
jgi:hypothetical protein